jgi:hypothetical protein
MKIFRKIVHINNTILSLIIFSFQPTTMINPRVIYKRPLDESVTETPSSIYPEGKRQCRAVEVPQILPDDLRSLRIKDYPDIDEMPPKVLELWSFKEFLLRLRIAKDLGTPHYDDLPKLRKIWVDLMKDSNKHGNTRMDNEREALSVIALILKYFEKDLGHYNMVSKNNGVITLEGYEIPRLYDMGYIREIAHPDDQAKMEKLLSDLLCGHELKIKVVT